MPRILNASSATSTRQGLDPSHIRLQCQLTSPMCLIESNPFKRSALSVGHVDSGGANSKNCPAHDQNQCSRHQCLCACQRGLLCTRPQEILRTVHAPPNLLTEIARWTLHKTSSGQKTTIWELSITNAPGADTSFKEALTLRWASPASLLRVSEDRQQQRQELFETSLAAVTTGFIFSAARACGIIEVRHTNVKGTASTAGAGATDTADTSTMCSATGAGTACTADWRSPGAGVA